MCSMVSRSLRPLERPRVTTCKATMESVKCKNFTCFSLCLSTRQRNDVNKALNSNLLICSPERAHFQEATVFQRHSFRRDRLPKSLRNPDFGRAVD